MKWLGSRLIILSAFLVFFMPSYAVQACCGCAQWDCGAAEALLNQYHDHITSHTNDEFDDDLKAFEKWMKNDFFPQEIVAALRQFTTQMNAVAMQHAQIVGSFLDAKNQMETQRLFQELQTEAHRDYVPSDQFCWFGTNVKSMASTMEKARFNAFVLAEKSMDRQLGNKNTKGADSVLTDMTSRWKYFRTNYCDINDDNRSPFFSIRSGTGLELACDHDGPGGNTRGGADKTFRVNLDEDYTRLVDLPRTLNVDFTDNNATSDNENEVIAMSENLYGHKVLSRDLSATLLKSTAAQNLYLALRSVAAKRSVAEFTFDSIVGLKSSGTTAQYKDWVESHPGALAPLSVGHARQFLAAIVKELYPYMGVSLGCPFNAKKLCDWDVYALIGDDPSYYSQLEIMGKKMYQNPDFYVKLYDTPANVERKGVAMKAIELMMDREIYESQLRREMAVSVLLSSKLKASERQVSEDMIKASAEK